MSGRSWQTGGRSTNSERPHSALDDRTPDEFKRASDESRAIALLSSQNINHQPSTKRNSSYDWLNEWGHVINIVLNGYKDFEIALRLHMPHDKRYKGTLGKKTRYRVYARRNKLLPRGVPGFQTEQRVQ